jgi:hypothetical protein
MEVNFVGLKIMLVEGFHTGYERKGIYPIEYVLFQLGNQYAVFDGDIISITSTRYHLFAQSTVCVRCGIKGEYFAKERNAKRIRNLALPESVFFKATTQFWHFNLYAINAHGHEILMTQDHIIPRSRGGRNHLSNLQVMCRPCNCHKADFLHYQSLLPFDDTTILAL